MATKLYLHDAANTLTGTFPTGTQSGATITVTWTGAATMRTMGFTPGTAQVTATGTASSTTQSQRHYIRTFVSPAITAAVTIAADTVTYFCADAQSNTGAGFCSNLLYIYVWRPSTGAKVGTLLGPTASEGGSAASAASTEQVTTFTSATTTAVTAATGDVIICELHSIFSESVKGAYTLSYYYDGTTATGAENAAISSAASYIQFNTDNIPLARTGSGSVSVSGAATTSRTANYAFTGSGSISVTKTDPGGVTRAVTIDHTKVGGSNLTNFPVLVSGAYSYLATVANGGLVTSSNGYDILFYGDNACTQLLPFEVESYDPTTGTIIAWVKVPSVSASTDTSFYLHYGDSSVTTDHSNASSVWSDYLSVYHGGTPTTLSGADATGNGRPVSVISGTVSASTGIIGGAFGCTNGSIATTSNYTALLGASATTISAWFYDPSAPSAGSNSANALRVSNSASIGPDPAPGYGGFVYTTSSVSAYDVYPPFGQWNYIVLVYDGSNITAYGNGNAGLSGSQTGSIGTPVGVPLSIGVSNYTDQIDEVRVCSRAIPASQIVAEYNNQSSTSTFYTLGSAASSFNYSYTTNSSSNTYSGSGSITLTGAATTSEELDYSGTGTITLSGSSTTSPIYNYVISGSGSVSVSGSSSASASKNYLASGSGTLSVNGSSVTTLIDAFTGSGSLSLSGSSTVLTTYQYVATGAGSITLSGASSTTEGESFSGGGSLQITGSAITAATAQYTSPAAGTVSVSGTSPYALGFSATAAGVLSLAGSSATTATVTYLPPASGSVLLSGASGTTDTVNYQLTAIGSLLIAGAAPTTSTESYSTSGTGSLSLSGSSPDSGTAYYTTPSSGSVTLTGSSPTLGTAQYVYAASGTLQLAGTSLSSETAQYTTTANGALQIAGASTTSVSDQYQTTGSGAVTLTGSAVTESSVGGSAFITGQHCTPSYGGLTVEAGAEGTLAGWQLIASQTPPRVEAGGGAVSPGVEALTHEGVLGVSGSCTFTMGAAAATTASGVLTAGASSSVAVSLPPLLSQTAEGVLQVHVSVVTPPAETGGTYTPALVPVIFGYGEDATLIGYRLSTAVGNLSVDAVQAMSPVPSPVSPPISVPQREHPAKQPSAIELVWRRTPATLELTGTVCTVRSGLVDAKAIRNPTDEQLLLILSMVA